MSKIPKNIMPSFKPMAAMQKAGIEGKEHGEVDKAVDAGVGLAKGGLKKILRWFTSVFGGIIFKTFVIILIISILSSILFSFISWIIEDISELFNPTVGQTGEYIRKVSEIESKSFSKAYNYTTENILDALVSEGSPFAALFSGEEDVKKKKDILAEYIQKGYVSMRDYNEYEGYLLFDMCIDGSQRVFAILEDETLGNKEDKQFSPDGNIKEWTNRLVIIDFGEAISQSDAMEIMAQRSTIAFKDIEDFVKNKNYAYFAGFDESSDRLGKSPSEYYKDIPQKDFYIKAGQYLGLIKSDKTNTVEFEDNISSMADEIINENTSGEIKESDREWLRNYAFCDIIRKNMLDELSYLQIIEGEKTEYILEYRNGTIMNQGVSVAMLESMYNYLYDYLVMEICGYSGTASDDIGSNEYLERRYEMFVKFMSKENVWKNLLTYNVRFEEDNKKQSYTLKDGDKDIIIPNITSKKTAVINVDLCDYKTLLSLFEVSLDSAYLPYAFGERLGDSEYKWRNMVVKYGDGDFITVSFVDEMLNEDFIRYMDGSSYSYNSYDLDKYTDIKFIVSNCYVKGDKTVELVNNRKTVLRDYRFKIIPSFGFKSYQLDSIKVLDKVLSEDDYTYDEKTGYYTVKADVINSKIKGTTTEFYDKYIMTIEAHGTEQIIDNINFTGFRYFAVKEYIQSVKGNDGTNLYDVVSYIADYDNNGKLQKTTKPYTGKYDVIYETEYTAYDSGAKRGKYTLYVVPGSGYATDIDSAIDFMYFTKNENNEYREMTLNYYFNDISGRGKIIQYKLGTKDDAIILDPDMAYMHFVEACRISGDDVAAILTEGGYVRSSVFWQYKTKMYSVMFIDPTAEPIHMPFFVDTNYILDIKEVKNAKTAGKNTTTYVIYCEPGTVIYQPNSSYIDSIYGVDRDAKGSNYYFISEHGSPYNSWLSDLVSTFATSRTDYDPIYDKDGKEVQFAHVKNKSLYNTYYLSDFNYRYKLANVQTDYINVNGTLSYILKNDYDNNHYDIYLKNPAYTEAPTIEEYFLYWEQNKDNLPDKPLYHVEDRVNILQPVILGCTLSANTMNKSNVSGGNISAFTLEIYPRYTAAKRHMTVSREVDIYKLFNINLEKDIYFDEGSGFFWPVEGEVNYKNVLVASKEFNVIGEDQSSGKLYIADKEFANVYTLSQVDFEFTKTLKNKGSSSTIYAPGSKLSEGETIYFLNEPKIKRIETNMKLTGSTLNIDGKITIVDADYINDILTFTTPDWDNFYIYKGVDVADIIVSQLKKNRVEYALVVASIKSNGAVENPDPNNREGDWEYVKRNIAYLGETYGKDYKKLTGLTFYNAEFKVKDTITLTMEGTGFEYKTTIDTSGNRVDKIVANRKWAFDYRPINLSKLELGYVAFTINNLNSKKYTILNVKELKQTANGVEIILLDETYDIKVEDAEKVPDEYKITMPIVDGYETFGNGLFQTGITIPYPEGYYMEDSEGVFTPVYAPVDSFVYKVVCTDINKGIYNVVLYNEDDEMYFEFIGIQSYYGQRFAFYPSEGSKVIAGDIIGKYRRIPDSGGVENIEWYNPVVYLIYNDNLSNKSVQFNKNNKVLVSETAYIYDIVKTEGANDMFNIILADSQNPGELSIYYTYHNVKLIDKSIAAAYWELKSKGTENVEKEMMKLFGNMRIAFGDELAIKTDKSYLTVAYGKGDASEKFTYYFNPLYFYTDTQAFNEKLIWAAFYNQNGQKTTSLVIQDSKYSNKDTTAVVKLNVSPEELPEGYTISVKIEKGNHSKQSPNVKINSTLGNYEWEIGLVNNNGYGTDYIVATLKNPEGNTRELARCAITVPSYAEYGDIYLSCAAGTTMISNSYYNVNSLEYKKIALYENKKISAINSSDFKDALYGLLNRSASTPDTIGGGFGYIDLFVPKTPGGDDVRYDFNAYYKGAATQANIEWILYKAVLDGTRHTITEVRNDNYISLNPDGILRMKKDANGSPANTSTEFYIVCARNIQSGALAYAVVRAVQPVENVVITSATYTFNGQGVKPIQYTTAFNNMHMTPFGELTINYVCEPQNATYKDISIFIKDNSTDKIRPEDITNEFIINFSNNMAKIKCNPNYGYGIIYDFFSGARNIEYLFCAIEIGESNSGKIRDATFVISADVNSVEIIPWDGDRLNAKPTDDDDIEEDDDTHEEGPSETYAPGTINVSSPAIMPINAKSGEYYPVAMINLSGYYCLLKPDGKYEMAYGMLPYPAARSVSKTGSFNYIVSSFRDARIRPIQSENNLSGNVYLEVMPYTAEKQRKIVYITFEDKSVLARITWLDRSKTVSYEFGDIRFEFYPYEINDNGQLQYYEDLFMEMGEESWVANEYSFNPFGMQLRSIFEPERNELGTLYRWKVSVYIGNSKVDTKYIDFATFLYLMHMDHEANMIRDARGEPRFIDYPYICDILDHREGNTKYVFEKEEYMPMNDEELCLITEMITGKTMAPVFITESGTYNNSVRVEISHPNRYAEIYYTTDGTTPTRNSKKYTGPFEVKSSCIVKAIAIVNHEGIVINKMDNRSFYYVQDMTFISDTAQASYTINTVSFVSKPTIMPTGGSYTVIGNNKMLVRISCSTPDAKIYYTTNGTSPKTNGIEYTSALQLGRGTYMIKAVAVVGNVWSEEITVVYYIYDSNMPLD